VQEEQAKKDGLEEVDPSEAHIDPAWTKIGRVVAELGSEPPKPKAPAKGGKAAKRVKKQEEESSEEAGEKAPRYLIKWQGLPYEEASWEVEQDVRGEDFDRELAKMRGRLPICQLAQSSAARVRDCPLSDGVVWCGVVWCGVAWRGVAWCGWCGVCVWCLVWSGLV